MPKYRLTISQLEHRTQEVEVEATNYVQAQTYALANEASCVVIKDEVESLVRKVFTTENLTEKEGV